LRELLSHQVYPALCEKLLSGGGTTRRWPTDSDVIEMAISRQIYNAIRTPALRLILERIELAERTKKSENLEIPSGLQIEHVLPEKWAEHWPLRGKTVPANVAMFPYLAADEFAELAEAIRIRNTQLQTLGNLTLLNKYLNPAAGNGSFDMKLVEYRNSVLRLNRYFDGRKNWDEDAITDRSRVLGETLCKIWPRPNGTGSVPDLP